MYRRILRIMAAATLLFTFWPVLRLAGLAIFDWAAPLFVLASLPYHSKERDATLPSFRLPILGIIIFTFAAVMSMVWSSDIEAHIQKVAQLLLALTMMLCFAYVISRKNIFTVTEALALLAFSGAISSFVCILQGKFGLLVSLVPMLNGDIEEWNRLTGLTEHPIEAGTVSTFSIVILLGLALHMHRWIICLPLIAINLYSMKYSASLTATFGLVASIAALCIYARAYTLLVCGFVGGCILIVVGFSTGALGTLLERRLEGIVESKGNYETLETRQDQWKKTVDGIDLNTLLFGNGYSPADLPQHREIHNGVLAAVFHFGVLGLMSQYCLIWFFVGRLRGDSPPVLKGILFGCIIVFASAYLTGPPFSRRSLWIPVFIMAAYLPERKSNTKAPLRIRSANVE